MARLFRGGTAKDVQDVGARASPPLEPPKLDLDEVNLQKVLETPPRSWRRLASYIVTVLAGGKIVAAQCIGTDETLGGVIISNINLGSPETKVLQEYVLADWLWWKRRELFSKAYSKDVVLTVKPVGEKLFSKKRTFHFKDFGVFDGEAEREDLRWKAYLLEEILEKITRKRQKNE